jgi:hypothetical protein
MCQFKYGIENYKSKYSPLMANSSNVTATEVIEYFKKLDIELSLEDAALVLEHLLEINCQNLDVYFDSLKQSETNQST